MENNKSTNKRTGNNTSSLVLKMALAGMMAALAFVGPYALHFPYLTGTIHAGDGFVFLSGILLGPLWGGIAAALGMAGFDIFSGYAIWAPYTFLIKLVMAVLVGFASKGLKEEVIKKSSWVKLVLMQIIAAIWMIAGYYVAEALIFSNWVTPINSVFMNLLQVGFGVVTSLFVFTILHVQFKRLMNMIN